MAQGDLSSKCVSATDSELQLKVALLRFVGEMNGTLNLFGFHMKFFGNYFWRHLEKDSLLCACFAHWLHIGTKMGIWVLELPFGVNHPAALFPFLLQDRFPRLFLFRVIC